MKAKEKEEVNLKDLQIPKEHAVVVWDRIQPYIRKHYNSMKLNSLYIDIPSKPFGMKELLISVYTQGLVDGNQIIKK